MACKRMIELQLIDFLMFLCGETRQRRGYPGHQYLIVFKEYFSQ
jgi:hypothetical protein